MERIKELILRYLREECSDEELTELEGWLSKSPANRELLVELQDAGMMANAFAKLDGLHKDAVWDRVSAYSEQQKAGSATTHISGNSGFRRFWWAAAASILLVGVAWWFTTRNTKETTIASLPARQDIQPGHNGAVLHLSNGQTVVLDSAQDGTIATQGAVKVVKANGALTYLGHNHEVIYNEVTTDRGRQYQLTLPDGTRVWLNAESSIHYPVTFTGKNREVDMTGEVYFEVAHNAKQPFRVKCENKLIEDIGTAFNINAYADESVYKTTLVEGSVRIGSEVVLQPGQQAQWVIGSDRGNARSPVTVTGDVDISQVLAWKNGLFAFTDADLPTVMRQLARWYNVDVTYNGTIPKRQFNGKIGKTLTLDQVLKILTKTRVHYSIEGKKLTIQP